MNILFDMLPFQGSSLTGLLPGVSEPRALEMTVFQTVAMLLIYKIWIHFDVGLCRFIAAY